MINEYINPVIKYDLFCSCFSILFISNIFSNCSLLNFFCEIMSAGECVITKEAPAFTATAVIKGDFKEVSLSDFKG